MEYRNILASAALITLLGCGAYAASAAKVSPGAPVGQFQLLDRLRDHGESPPALEVEDVIASNGDLYFFVKAPRAFVRTSKSGEVLAYVTLEPRDDFAMDVAADGRVVAADFAFENLMVFDADGSLQSSIPLEFSLGSWCNGDGDLSRLCLLFDGRLPRRLRKSPPLMLRMGLPDGGFAVVDGIEAVLHLGDRTMLQAEPIPLSNPTLDPIRKEVAIETGKDNSTALLIMDAESHDGALYLLLGSGSRAGEGVIMRYSRLGDYLDSHTVRVDMMPQFIAVESGRLYLSDHQGRVAAYALP
ncbi:MAG: hypothetical protein GY953_39630 [bacterium]|nr:hypothetical protein [bacterium]